jgi:hypothetical protein
MRIGYRTIDEVNRYFAQRLAAAHRARLCPLEAGNIPQEGKFDLVIYDFDFLPSDEQASVVHQLLSMAARPARRIVVHGHNLDENVRDSLKARGVRVLRMLVPNMFKYLQPPAA